MAKFFNSDERKVLSKLVQTARGDDSLRVFADKVGVSYSAIQAWEKQTGDPGWDSLEKLAQATGYSLMGLYCIIKNQYPNPKEVLEMSKNWNREDKISLAAALLQDSKGEDILYGNISR